jgi:pSer/pThr/pTyr-binding forkhead associated (FHA) protein/tetratricopeptide (TPR) repeat protein
MAQLRVSLHGNVLLELNLQPGQEYFAGRGAQCQIILAHERGISRQHLRIFEQNDAWCVQLISKYGGILYQGQNVQELSLQGEIQFGIPPYEFYFSENVVPAEATIPIVHPVKEVPEIHVEQNIEIEQNQPQQQDGNWDATMAGASTLIAYLKIVNNKLKTEDVLKLEGNVWTVGRHPTCEVVINDSAVSRQHFDLTKTPEGYFVLDHGSSNGTHINGEKIPAQTPQRVVSGDILSIREIEIIFEIHDGEYKNKMQALPEFTPALEASQSHALVPIDSSAFNTLANDYHDNNQSEHYPAVLKIPSGEMPFAPGFQFNKIHIIIGILGLILLYGLFSSNSPSPSTANNSNDQIDSSSQALPQANELSPEKQKELKDIFNLAHGYYLQRKYTLCLSNIEKLHGIVPFYANSKEVENLCRQAQELEQIDLDRRRKEEARIDTENKIRKNVDECRAQMKPTTTSDEMTICLQPALELDPQNALAMDLVLQIQAQETLKKDGLQKQAEFQRRKQEGQTIYNRAVSMYKNGQLKLALKEFRRYKSGRYPGLNQIDDDVSRNITSIEQTMESELNAEVAKCQSALDRQDYKDAYTSCSRVLKENPGNAKAREVKNKAWSLLRKEMKPLYEDGAFEESVGNIEAAKEKWKKIVNTSVPQDDYYKKAKQKLKKYGEGF